MVLSVSETVSHKRPFVRDIVAASHEGVPHS